MKNGRRSRRLHRLLAPIAAAHWLLRVHTGNFSIINLKPIDSLLIGILTLVLVISSVCSVLESRAA